MERTWKSREVRDCGKSLKGKGLVGLAGFLMEGGGWIEGISREMGSKILRRHEFRLVPSRLT